MNGSVQCNLVFIFAIKFQVAANCICYLLSDSWADPRARQLRWRAAPRLLTTNIWHAHIRQEIPGCSSCSSTQVINSALMFSTYHSFQFPQKKEFESCFKRITETSVLETCIGVIMGLRLLVYFSYSSLNDAPWCSLTNCSSCWSLCVWFNKHYACDSIYPRIIIPMNSQTLKRADASVIELCHLKSDL